NLGPNVTHDDRQRVEKNLFVKGGTNTNYNQTTNVNVLLPLNKIPALDFITQASGKYTANYQWQRRPFAVDTIGNTIQNAQTQAYTTQLNMVNLYNKIPYLKRINQNLPKPKKDKKKEEDKKKKDAKADPKNPQADKNQPPANTAQAKPDTSKKKDSNPLEIFDHLARILMTVKQISANYNITQGTTLPGFAPEASILGTSNNGTNGQFGAPGLGFVFGGNQGKMATSSSDILSQNATGIIKDAENKNWLVHRQNFSTQYLHTKTQTFNYSANVEPIKNLKVTFTGNMTHGQTESYFIGYHDTDSHHVYNPGYDHLTPVFGGNYSISTITLSKYSFSKDDQAGTHNSQIFDNYMHMRSDYSNLLAIGNTNSHGKYETGFHDGYNGSQQDVVVGAFISAYTGHTTATSKNTGDNIFKKIPLPGWNLTYDGLGKMPAIKKYFKSVVLTHGYRSTLSYGSYTNNQAYGEDALHHATKRVVDSIGSTSNFVSQYVMNTVSVSESFSPLIKVNFMFVDKGKIKGLGANFEIKRDRMSTLSSNVPQVMDMHSSEYNIGATYTLPQVEIKRLKIRGKPLKSDLLSTVTLSFRQTQTALRKVVATDNTGGEIQASQISTGQNITTIKVSLTYSLTQNVNLRIYYDRTINKPVISTSFPTQTTNAGLSLRFVIQ
ncbi:MAG TPA: cell surface protein SprA, partial [Bacteroidia bacterium]|nr:cell surface protein SprA [Bacteroidia bacterium]